MVPHPKGWVYFYPVVVDCAAAALVRWKMPYFNDLTLTDNGPIAALEFVVDVTADFCICSDSKLYQVAHLVSYPIHWFFINTSLFSDAFVWFA